MPDIAAKKYVPLRSPAFPVTDAHTHFGRLLLGEGYAQAYDLRRVCEEMRAAGVARAVVLELEWDEGYEQLLRALEPAGEFLEPFGSVDVRQAMSPGFETLVYRQIRRLKADGCCGLKLWKDITLRGREYFGCDLPLDSPRLAPIFRCCAEEKLPVVMHVGDHPCFFAPPSPDAEYYSLLRAFPEWSFYGRTSFTFADHMRMQENLLRDNPGTTFVIAHVGSWAEELPQVSRWLEQYPNLFVDIAAQTEQLGRKARESTAFLRCWQDRVLFGTDFSAGKPPEEIGPFYATHYDFLETHRRQFDSPAAGVVDWKIDGLGLEPEILRKLYAENAERVLGIGQGA